MTQPNPRTISRRSFLACSALSTALLTAGDVVGSRAAAGAPAADRLRLADPANAQLKGHLGRQLDLCLHNRVMAQPLGPLIAPFRAKAEVGDGDWRCEYWGKWYTSAVEACSYDHTPTDREVIDRAVTEIIATRDADGYIGTRKKPYHLLGWDVWGRKYVLLGLMANYSYTGNAAVLDAARKHADSLISEVGPGKANIADVGYAGWKGLPPSSVLEPIVLLYRATRDERYLQFAQYIVGQWSRPSQLAPNGMRLVEDAASGVPASHIDAPKAYEMTSCFEGLCELYRTTGNALYLKACKALANSIISAELFIVGSGSSREVWFGGRTKQTLRNPDPMETCVTATWMKYCCQLLRLTGDSTYADQLEISLYNALLGALKPDGSWWCYYTPLSGQKVPSHIQHADVGLSCCVTNGPRALFLTPMWAVMSSDDGPAVNLYNAGIYKALLPSGSPVTVTQETNYPETGKVNLGLSLARAEKFALRLRIPGWCSKAAVRVNNRSVPAAAVAGGTYCVLHRRWKPGDQIVIDFEMPGRVIDDPGGSGKFAIQRGPVVFARDMRLQPNSGVEDLFLFPHRQGTVPITVLPKAAHPGIWMGIETSVVNRRTGNSSGLRLCDYASAGNTWTPDSRFEVWMNRSLGPLTPPVPILTGASWIWFGGDPGDPRVAAPVCTRWFRRTFRLPATIKIKRAVLTVTGDDSFTASLNGTELGGGADWGDPQAYDVTHQLRNGSNTIAVEVTNTNPSPAGLIARLVVEPFEGAALTVVTDNGWYSTDHRPMDWKAPMPNDIGFTAARVLGPLGCDPWYRVR